MVVAGGGRRWGDRTHSPVAAAAVAVCVYVCVCGGGGDPLISSQKPLRVIHTHVSKTPPTYLRLAQPQPQRRRWLRGVHVDRWRRRRRRRRRP